MHTNEVILHGENVKTTWDASYRYCIVKKAIRNESIAGGGTLRTKLHTAFPRR